MRLWYPDLWLIVLEEWLALSEEVIFVYLQPLGPPGPAKREYHEGTSVYRVLPRNEYPSNERLLLKGPLGP